MSRFFYVYGRPANAGDKCKTSNFEHEMDVGCGTITHPYLGGVHGECVDWELSSGRERALILFPFFWGEGVSSGLHGRSYKYVATFLLGGR